MILFGRVSRLTMLLYFGLLKVRMMFLDKLEYYLIKFLRFSSTAVAFTATIARHLCYSLLAMNLNIAAANSIFFKAVRVSDCVDTVVVNP